MISGALLSLCPKGSGLSISQELGYSTGSSVLMPGAQILLFASPDFLIARLSIAG